ncbi:N-ethylmaleimide reductase [compost metagenome]
MSPLQLAYLHAIRSPDLGLDVFALARRHFRGSLIINDAFDASSAQRALAENVGEAVSFGRPFIANPDLVQRLRDQVPLSELDQSTIYSPGPHGYTDYPTMARI